MITLIVVLLCIIAAPVVLGFLFWFLMAVLVLVGVSCGRLKVKPKGGNNGN